MNSSFQIVVPLFNEEEVLETILERAASGGYLHKTIFVDDASADGSRAVLRKWVRSHDIRVVFLDTNRKKEGAIREVLELLAQRSRLEPYTIILDADSFFEAPANGTSVVDAIEAAITSMRERDLAGLAFRIDAAVGAGSNFLEHCAFADYSSMQFDHWVTSRQRQVWVINGPGGLFRSDLLLETLRSMQPDFDTGDLLITVKLMSRGYGVAYYPDIRVLTFVPRTLRAYFNQRRRWERGTTKVVWWERAFYARLFVKRRLLAIETLIHLSLYPGIAMAAIGMASTPSDPLKWIAISYAAWLAINLVKGVFNKPMRSEGLWWRYVGFCAANGLVWSAVTMWARCAGFADALWFFARRRALAGACPSAPSEAVTVRL